MSNYKVELQVPMEKAKQRRKDGSLINGRNVVLTVGLPDAENRYTYSEVHRISPTKIERFIYTSLATLGGIATGLITYFKLIQPLISR